MNSINRVAEVFAFFVLIFACLLPAGAQTNSIYHLAAGTKLKLRMDTAINSRFSSANDTFTATLADPVKVRDAIVLPSGLQIEGRIIATSKAEAFGRPGKLEVEFGTIKFYDGLEREIEGELTKPLKPDSRSGKGLLAILGGTAAGAAVGGIFGQGRGALIGGVIGGGAGTAAAVVRKGKDVGIDSDEEFEIVLKDEFVVPVRDY